MVNVYVYYIHMHAYTPYINIYFYIKNISNKESGLLNVHSNYLQATHINSYHVKRRMVSLSKLVLTVAETPWYIS